VCSVSTTRADHTSRSSDAQVMGDGGWPCGGEAKTRYSSVAHVVSASSTIAEKMVAGDVQPLLRTGGPMLWAFRPGHAQRAVALEQQPAARS